MEIVIDVKKITLPYSMIKICIERLMQMSLQHLVYLVCDEDHTAVLTTKVRKYVSSVENGGQKLSIYICEQYRTYVLRKFYNFIILKHKCRRQ